MHALKRLGATMLSAALASATGAAVAADNTASAGECFAAGFKAGDADAVAACYAEDSILWFPGGPMARGRAAIRDGFAGYLARVTVSDIKMTSLGQEVVGDTRVGWGTYEISTVDKASKAESVERGRYTDIQKKIDGRWQYTVDHPSDDPPAAE